jgi:hypothetical protein
VGEHFSRDLGQLFDLGDTILTQYSMKQGLNKFGVKVAEAVTVELELLHDREVMTPVGSRSLSREEKQRKSTGSKLKSQQYGYASLSQM